MSKRRRWYTEIVESDRILEGRPLDLTEALDRLDRQGWSVEFVLPNGVNRWTVIASSDEGIQ